MASQTSGKDLMSIGDLIGKPYVRDCYDGTGFDCWSLIWWIYKNEKINLQTRSEVVWCVRDFAKEIRERTNSWQQVQYADRKWMDVLLFATSRNMNTHVGMVLDKSRFIHTRPETGVVIGKFSKDIFSATIKKVYRYNGSN